MQTTATLPLVSVITPVYNGAPYLRACIESVLAQTYTNLEYVIVNNCSIDESLRIAQEYACRNDRIRIVNNRNFLGIIENHNHAVRQMSPEAKYCKMVFADDWLYPRCVEKMVGVAEENPSVGLVGAYTTDGCRVLWSGLPDLSSRASGHDVCRSMLLGGQYVLGPMTSLLVRAELIRKRQPFFDERTVHGDTVACFDVLQGSDYGYVHQVLSFSRQRPGSASEAASNLDSIILGAVVTLLGYGPVFLSNAEYKQRWKRLWREYHGILAVNILRARSSEFWKYHEDTLAAFGAHIDRKMLAAAVLAKIARQAVRPVQTAKRSYPWWSQALRRIWRGATTSARVAPGPGSTNVRNAGSGPTLPVTGKIS